MHFPALKIGPGDSARSHTANEYILLSEIEKGIEGYIALIKETALQFESNN
jgi:acetylornithine deacetylase